MPARALVLLIAVLSYAGTGRAATLQWDTAALSIGAQGGTGNWLGTDFWWLKSDVSWVSGSAASFGPSAGTVTVNGAVTADSLSFSTGGYTVSGSSTLTLSGADTIEVTNSSDSATISATLGGTGGFAKTGDGTLTLSGSATNSYSGTAMVSAGTLNLSKTAGRNAITGNLTIGAGNVAPSSVIVTQGANNQIADTATVTVNQDGFWNLASGNHSETIGGLVMTYESNVATGSGKLTLNGDVTVSTAGGGAYPGATINGLLDLGGATRTFSGSAPLGFAPPPMDISATISNGGLTVLNGLLTLSGTAANTYTGTTTVTTAGMSDAVLTFNKPAGVNAIGGDLIIGTGVASVGQQANEQIPDTATVTVAGKWNLENHAETIGGLNVSGGNVGTGTTGVLTVNGNISSSGGSIGGAFLGQLALGDVTRVIDVSSGQLGINAAISNGTGGITKIGAGTLSLFGANTFTGPLAINGGTLLASSIADSGFNSIGTGSSISFDGGTLAFLSDSSSTTSRDVVLNAGGGTLDLQDPEGPLMLSGTISGAGALTKIGAGTLVLGGNSEPTYAGTTIAADGTLTLNKPANVNAVPGDLAIGDGNGPAASAIVTESADEQIRDSAIVTIATDGFWNLASGNHSETIAAIVMTSGSIATGGGTLTMNGNITTNASAASATISGQLNLGGATRTLDVADGAAAIDLDISAAISEGGVTKTGAGTLQLSGANSFSGPVAVSAGMLIAHGGSAIGDASDVTVASGATLTIDGNETVASLAGAGAAMINTGSTLTVGGGTAAFSGAISGPGGLAKTGGGSLTLSAQPTYTGNTLVSGGTLALNKGIAGGSGVITVGAAGMLQARSIVSRAVAGNGTITATGTLVIGDAGSTTGFGFDGMLNVGSNIVVLADADAAQLGASTTLGNAGRLDSLNGATLAGGRSIAASASAAVSGPLTNNGTVTGPTASGQSLTLLGDVNGTGRYTGHIDFSAGFSPGVGAAAVSLENFTLDSTATLALELGGTAAGTQYDQLNFTGAGVLGGMLSISLINGFNPQAGNVFTLLAGSALSGTFNSIQMPALTGSLEWNTSQLYTAGVLSVVLPGDYNHNGVVEAADYVVWRKGLGITYTQSDYDVWRSHFGQTASGGSAASVSAAIPEPSTLALLIVGILAMGSRRRVEVS